MKSPQNQTYKGEALMHSLNELHLENILEYFAKESNIKLLEIWYSDLANTGLILESQLIN